MFNFGVEVWGEEKLLVYQSLPVLDAIFQPFSLIQTI